MFRIALILAAVFCLGPTAAFGQTPEEKANPKKRSELNKAELKSLFKQLGADSYELREAASMKLLAYGRVIVPALEKLYSESKDPEVKGRAYYIAKKIHRDRLTKKGKGYLGVRINTGATNNNGNSIVEINSVDANLPAAKVGLKKGDRIIQVNKMKIENFDQLKAAITSFAAGDKITVVVLRGKKKLTVHPVLARFPEPQKTTTIRPQIQGQIRPRVQILPNNAKKAAPKNAAILKMLRERLATLKKAKNPDKQQIARLEQVIKTLKAQPIAPPVPVVPRRKKVAKPKFPALKPFTPNFKIPAQTQAFPKFKIPNWQKQVFPKIPDPRFDFPKFPSPVFPNFEMPKPFFPKFEMPKMPKPIFPNFDLQQPNFQLDPKLKDQILPRNLDQISPKLNDSIFPKLEAPPLKLVKPSPKKDKKDK